MTLRDQAYGYLGLDPASLKANALAYLDETRADQERAQRRWTAAVLSAVRNGASFREVADAAGISHTQVKRMVDAATPTRPS